MANDLTTLEQMIDPEVMGEMILAQLPKAIKFGAIAPIDDTLSGRPGDTITVPRWKYIGDAKDVAEGAAIDYAKMTNSTDTFTVKKAAKGVKLTDEAVLSGYGDPVGEATRQIAMAIASKLDNDTLATATKSRLTLASADFTKLDFIDTIEAAFIDDTSDNNFEGDDANAQGVIYMNPKDVNKVRKVAAQDWERATALGDSILSTGVFGGVLGWQFIRSRKVPVGSAIVAKPGAMKTYLKRAVQSETGRDMDAKSTKFNADMHYGVAIYDDTKLLAIKPFTYADGTVIDQNVTSVENKSVRKSNKLKPQVTSTAV
ncbi:N4-gp56 family major capsid protein [Leuconostoc mesenteroides]|uniref:N4-gp56 family major capsid protein n=1 Tax=Leuconostoc mesenteroides TaxID=1245 RepID=UPI0009FD8E00|nr:N4-gp56 family major capsid protein [Leuconostoc mesenteroides]ARN63725.1 major capsid protein [Leuconostoc mesenteroides subsp. mesenteroides]MBZ1502617.1 N4-gp56 family major capsid protein [Leuconostoc mesenteroides]MDV8928422.1 N4-gp56 family major capsid protein [Leuconostoc mesenteroides]ORI79597.1 N4-gp56 family major capsid protein [Leuconostoc mesenteroides subsp. mesenteroides]ORI89596.1 N4-gp56 family major capsid protein [Leuconostoc mesenteroides subsp. mesenteroides]